MEIEDYIIADDQRLITLVLGGDDVAFEYLFNRYREPILRLLIQRIGNAHDADDLLQETDLPLPQGNQLALDLPAYGYRWIRL